MRQRMCLWYTGPVKLGDIPILTQLLELASTRKVVQFSTELCLQAGKMRQRMCLWHTGSVKLCDMTNSAA